MSSEGKGQSHHAGPGPAGSYAWPWKEGPVPLTALPPALSPRPILSLLPGVHMWIWQDPALVTESSDKRRHKDYLLGGHPCDSHVQVQNQADSVPPL
jgi:hypothetical protein